MTTTVGEPLGGDWPKVLDVIGHDRALLACGGIQNFAVKGLHQVVAVSDGIDVESTFSQHPRDLGRELLIEQRLHEARACLPASEAAYPRSHSA